MIREFVLFKVKIDKDITIIDKVVFRASMKYFERPWVFPWSMFDPKYKKTNVDYMWFHSDMDKDVFSGPSVSESEKFIPTKI